MTLEHDTLPANTGGDDSSSMEATRPLRPSDASAIRADDVEIPGLRAGEQVGRYLVLESLGHGGMSLVYTAYDPKLDRRVALKLMRPDGGERPDKAQDRLLREAQAMARMAHPNVVRVYDVGVYDQRVYMAMELVEGQTLRDWVQGRARSWRAIIDVLVRAGRGLAAAHDAGLVHLDVKPRNILVGDDGEVRVADFGLARAARPSDSMASQSIASLDDSSMVGDDRMTQAGMVMGTPGYMAPEQLEGAQPDARSDQFSFCVALFEALYGQRPFRGRRMSEYRRSLKEGIEEPPSTRTVPTRIRRLLERGLCGDPTQRYASLDELLDAMAVDRRRAWRLGAALTVVAGLVAGGTWALARSPPDPCADQAQRLEGTWDDARREQAHARLSAFDASRARPQADALVAELDDYAQRWVQAATEACRASKVKGREASELADVRNYCLELRRGQLRASTDLLLQGESTLDDEWQRVIAELPRVEGCRDITSLYEVGRPPTDEALREAVAQVDLAIARAWARIRAGRLTEALQEAEAAVEAADATGYRPLIAKAWLVQAAVLSLFDRREDAERIGFEAARMADVEGMHRVRVEAMLDLIYNVGVLNGRHEEAEHMGQNALWLEHHLIGDPDLRSQLLSNLGAVDASAGRYERARERYSAAMQLLEDNGLDIDRLNVASTILGLGAVELQLGNFEQALEIFHRSRLDLASRYGEAHPTTLVAIENEATALHSLERYEEALQLLEQAREWAKGSSDGGKSAATRDATMGAIYIELGRHAEAEEALERTRAVFEAGHLRPLLLGVTRGNLAMATLEQGKLEAGLRHATEGAVIIEEQLGPEHVYLAWVLGLRARAELRVEAPLAALEHAGRAWAILEAAQERGDPMVEPEFRAEAALAIARALADPGVAGQSEAIERWGQGRSSKAWGERALAEAKAGGRAVQSVRERARRWLDGGERR